MPSETKKLTEATTKNSKNNQRTDIRPRSALSAVGAGLKWALGNTIIQRVAIVALIVLSFVNGVKWGPVLEGPEPPDVIYAPSKPMAGETDAVLSLQILRPDRDPHHRCTATLIDNPLTDKDDKAGEWALTAAHCVTRVPPEIEKTEAAASCEEDASNSATSMKVDHPETAPFVLRGDTAVYTRGGQTVAVAQRFVVSGWNWGRTPGKPYDDLALLHLAHRLNIKPMALATNRQPHGYFGVVYGWSVGADRGCRTDISPDLQQFPVRIDPCPAGPESSRNVCAGTPNDSAGPCDGVSGGPIVSLDAKEHPVLQGVYSMERGRYCGQGTMFFSSVPQYRQWVLDKMATHS